MGRTAAEQVDYYCRHGVEVPVPDQQQLHKEDVIDMLRHATSLVGEMQDDRVVVSYKGTLQSFDNVSYDVIECLNTKICDLVENNCGEYAALINQFEKVQVMHGMIKKKLNAINWARWVTHFLNIVILVVLPHVFVDGKTRNWEATKSVAAVFFSEAMVVTVEYLVYKWRKSLLEVWDKTVSMERMIYFILKNLEILSQGYPPTSEPEENEKTQVTQVSENEKTEVTPEENEKTEAEAGV